MLIRVLDHFRNNPKRIDKLIAVKGLPKEWMFTEGPNGLELKKPWTPDIDANIPQHIRHLCDPMYLIFRYPPVERGANWIVEKRQILGVRIDYNTQPGQEMWDQVERYIEESTPRDERVPVPVLCAKDERSAFETYTPRRTASGSLELVPSDVPMVDLTRFQKQPMDAIIPVVLEASATTIQSEAKEAEFKCDECDYTHRSKQGVRMHKTFKHKKEKAGVS